MSVVGCGVATAGRSRVKGHWRSQAETARTQIVEMPASNVAVKKYRSLPSGPSSKLLVDYRFLFYFFPLFSLLFCLFSVVLLFSFRPTEDRFAAMEVGACSSCGADWADQGFVAIAGCAECGGAGLTSRCEWTAHRLIFRRDGSRSAAAGPRSPGAFSSQHPRSISDVCVDTAE